MLRWALTGADAGKVTTTGNAAHDLSVVYETGKETVLNKVDRINNVYDLEGNGREWTAEVYYINYRTRRGGTYEMSHSPSKRDGNDYGYPTRDNDGHCSRSVLYIK